MLLEFRVSNFRSFDEEQTFSMIGGSDSEHEGINVTDQGGIRVVKAAALYGANSSGKSNFTKALSCAQSFISKSATEMNLGDPIELTPFVLHEENKSLPSLFEFALLLDNVRYDYGFSATQERVYGEWIVAYPKGRAQQWLDRTYDPEMDVERWKRRGPLDRRVGNMLSERTRPNGLALSRGAELSVEELAPLYLWFKNKLRVLDLSQSPETLLGVSLARFQENEAFGHRVRELIRDADMGITDVNVSKKRLSDENLPRQLPSEVRSEILKRIGEGSILTWTLSHRNEETGELANLAYESEAGGTQRMLALAGPWWDSLDGGYTLVVDELDCSLHPHLARKLVELFQNPEFNAGRGQLIFTTHDTTMMDLTLLRRDQIWITEKQRSGASKLFSLYDFEEDGEKIRRGAAVQRRYLAGRYGGVPTFGASLEDLR